MSVNCDRIRIGGTVSGSSITGGTTIGGQDIAITSYSGLQGFPGRRGQVAETLARDGGGRPNDWDYRPRLLTLNVAAYDLGADGSFDMGITERCEQLEANIDTLMGLVNGDTDGDVVIERDMADGSTRWISGIVLEAFDLNEGPIFGAGAAAYQATVFVRCPHPWWQSETLNTQTISGAGTVTVAGNVRLSNPVLTFAGDSVLSMPGGVSLSVVGSSGAVVVDVGNRTVTEAGAPADSLLRPSHRYWARLDVGSNAVNRTGANIDIDWRDQWI
jgi:hypothetical protein